MFPSPLEIARGDGPDRVLQGSATLHTVVVKCGEEPRAVLLCGNHRLDREPTGAISRVSGHDNPPRCMDERNLATQEADARDLPFEACPFQERVKELLMGDATAARPLKCVPSKAI